LGVLLNVEIIKKRRSCDGLGTNYESDLLNHMDVEFDTSLIKLKELYFLNAHELAHYAAQSALEKKAEDIKIFNLQGISSVTDYFVIISGTTDVHVKAISNSIVRSLKDGGMRPRNVEGASTGRWVLIDYVDVIVHVFQPEIREFYGLERLWGDAKTEEVKDEAAGTGTIH